MKKRLVLIVAVAVVAVTGFAVSAAFGAAEHSSAGVNWHPQQQSQGNEGPVEDASAKLVRNKNGISYQLKTTELTPNHAYTLWLVVVNNPGACDPSPCTGPDIIENEDTNSQVLYGTGLVASSSGKGTFAGSLKEGELDGWLPNRTFDDAFTAEIHLVVNDHGPRIQEFMPEMIRTYRGGCSDASPFPGIFPDTALADGTEGPNTCRLYQSAILQPSE